MNKQDRHDSVNQFCQASLQWHRTFIHMHNYQVRCLHVIHKNGQLRKQVKRMLDDMQSLVQTSMDSCRTASVKVIF